MTGLKNRRHFEEAFRGEVPRAHRDGRRLALVVPDLDKFRRVNDELGHEKGDGVLRKFADRMREVARVADVTCRLGGEEFTVVLPKSSFEDAMQFSARLNDRLAAEPILTLWDVTVSAGVAEQLPTRNSTVWRRREERRRRRRSPSRPPCQRDFQEWRT